MQTHTDIVAMIFEGKNEFTELVQNKGGESLVGEFKQLSVSRPFVIYMKFLEALRKTAIEILCEEDPENKAHIARMQSCAWYPEIADEFMRLMTTKPAKPKTEGALPPSGAGVI